MQQAEPSWSRRGCAESERRASRPHGTTRRERVGISGSGGNPRQAVAIFRLCVGKAGQPKMAVPLGAGMEGSQVGSMLATFATMTLQLPSGLGSALGSPFVM